VGFDDRRSALLLDFESLLSESADEVDTSSVARRPGEGLVSNCTEEGELEAALSTASRSPAAAAAAIEPATSIVGRFVIVAGVMERCDDLDLGGVGGDLRRL